MVRESNRTFVYGKFIWPTMKKGPPLPPWLNEFAIEVLREYSATEFVGKLYTKAANQWVPIPQSTVSQYDWYKWFFKIPHFTYFEMDGSGRWDILHFRNESDESGPYVAIALRYHPSKPSAPTKLPSLAP